MGERGKINRPEHTAGGSQNKGTEKLKRRAAPSLLEEGGRGEGKGANSAPEKPPPPTLQTGPRFLSKDFLRPDWRRVLGPRREKAHRTGGECAKPLASWAAHRRGKRHATPGESARKPLALSRSPRREKARRAREEAVQTSGCPGRSPRREKARSTKGEAAQASGHLGCSQRGTKARHTRGEAAKTSGCLAGTRRVLPIHSNICLQRPALPAAGLN